MTVGIFLAIAWWQCEVSVCEDDSGWRAGSLGLSSVAGNGSLRIFDPFQFFLLSN